METGRSDPGLGLGSAARVRARRRDAQARREALIQAAAECFGENGYTVALEDIADRAGVGRGTLYRNFKDRMALILAIFEREVERLDVIIDPTMPLLQLLALIVKTGSPASFLFTRLASEAPMARAQMFGFEALGARLAQLVEPIAQIARARGEIRADVGGSDLVLAMRMAGGLLHPGLTAAEMDAEIELALRLLMRGLRAGA